MRKILGCWKGHGAFLHRETQDEHFMTAQHNSAKLQEHLMEQGKGKKTHCVQVSFQKECLFTGLVMSGKKNPTIKGEEKEVIRQTILGMFSPDMHETRKQNSPLPHLHTW